GSKPRNSVSARASYGTTASSSSRDPPGTRSRSAIAPLPPPVIASTALRPDPWVAAIICGHDAFSWRSALAGSTRSRSFRQMLLPPDGGRDSRRSQRRDMVETPLSAQQRRCFMWSRLLLAPALAVLLLSA